MTFEPKQKNKVPEVTVAALFVCAGVSFAFSAIELIPGKGFLQLLSMALICAMVFVFVRYKMTSFRYSIRVSAKREKKSLHHEDDDEEPVLAEGEIDYEEALSMPITSVPPKMLELCVERRQGKGAYTMECLVKLTDIECCYSLPEESELWAECFKSNKRLPKYKYFKNMATPDQMVLIASAPTGRVIAYLEKDEKMCSYLKAVSAFNNDK